MARQIEQTDTRGEVNPLRLCLQSKLSRINFQCLLRIPSPLSISKLTPHLHLDLLHRRKPVRVIGVFLTEFFNDSGTDNVRPHLLVKELTGSRTNVKIDLLFLLETFCLDFEPRRKGLMDSVRCIVI